jgi:MraZ protein
MSNSANVDQKGRLKIPANLLTTLNQHGTEFYITSENGDSVRIYPMQVWNQVEKRLKRLCSRNRNNEKLLVRAKYFGSAVTVDKQGRVLIPIGLRRSAQMRGAVDILDYLRYLEVWNHARFMKKLRNTPTIVPGEETLNKFISALRSPWATRPKKVNKLVLKDVRRFGMIRRLSKHSSRPVIHEIQEARTAPPGLPMPPVQVDAGI